MARRLEELGVSVLYALQGEAWAEGGDLPWLDHDTLAVGQSFHTNAEGLRQLREMLTGIEVMVIPVELGSGSHENGCPFKIVAMEKEVQTRIMHE